MRKPSARIGPLHHRGEKRIKVEFPKNDLAIAAIKEVPGRRWSRTHRCWHVPHSPEAYGQLLERFEVVLPDESGKAAPPPGLAAAAKNKVEPPSQPSPRPVFLEKENDRRLKAFVPPERKDWIALVKKIDGRAWNERGKYWSLPNVKSTYRLLKKELGGALKIGFEVRADIPETYRSKYRKGQSGKSPGTSGKVELPPYFTPAEELPRPGNLPVPEGRTALPHPIVVPPEVRYAVFQKDGREQRTVTGEKVIVGKQDGEWINAFVPMGKKGWVETMRNIPGRAWAPGAKCWQLPYVKASFRLMKKFIGMENLTFCFDINPDIPDEAKAAERFGHLAPHLQSGRAGLLNRAQKEAIALMVEKLALKRMAYNTQKSYSHHLMGLFLFYQSALPEDITKKQVEHYILHLVRFKKIAESTQNQVINAVKAYWERVLGRGKEWIELPRPKRPKKLPNIISQEEVVALLDCVDNLKHKLILLLIYATGMRLGESVNLLVRDINLKRRHIHIKGGKGKKDRYVNLPETVVPFLVAYKKEYRPAHWLFEGQHGGRYSKRSVQSIMRKAVEKSKINPYATVHTLRHSYATHCVEDGHGLLAIQEALGHESADTTRIYLHLSSNALRRLKSPVDKLNIKRK